MYSQTFFDSAAELEHPTKTPLPNEHLRDGLRKAGLRK